MAKGIKSLIAGLADKKGNVRQAAAEALGKLGDARAVKPLIAFLADKKGNVRQAATEALGKLGNARAVEPLIAVLADKEGVVRQAATEALGKLGDARAVEPLIAVLVDKEDVVRQAATKALGKLGDARAVEPLILVLADKKGNVCQAAAEALVKIGTSAVEPLIAVLVDKEGVVRQAATEALGKLGDARAVEPLIAVLVDKGGVVRQAAAEALGKLGDARAVEPLILVLADEVSSVRQSAAIALGELGDARAVEPLIVVLEDKVSSVRQSAATALDKLKWRPEANITGALYWVAKQDWERCVKLGALTVKPLIAVLADEVSSVRQSAAIALGKLGDARAVEPLATTLGDASWELRDSVAEALDKLRWQPRSNEEKVVYWLAKKQWELCAAIGELAIEPLVQSFEHYPPGECRNIRQVLAKHFGSHPSVAKVLAVNVHPLILEVEDERDVRELIVWTLQIGGFDVIEASNGEETVEKAIKFSPDLILLDVRMPKMTGYEACRILKAREDTRNIPIVFLSAKGQEVEINTGLELGAIEYFLKPFAPDELLLRVQKILIKHGKLWRSNE